MTNEANASVTSLSLSFDSKLIDLRTKQNRKTKKKKTSTFSSWRVAKITRLATSIACLCSELESRTLIAGLPSGNAAAFHYQLHTCFSLQHCNILSLLSGNFESKSKLKLPLTESDDVSVDYRAYDRLLWSW